MLKIFRDLKKQLTSDSVLPALNLLELVVVVAFVAIIFTAGYQVFSLSARIVDRSRLSTLALLQTQDLMELTISKRNEDWNSLVPGEYYLVEDPDPTIGFVFVSGQEVIDGFTRSVIISEVQRDVNGDIVSSGGTVDSDTFLIHGTASWTTIEGFSQQLDLYQYLSNWDGF